MSTESEPELTETQKAYNVAQYEIFQLAAYGHCTYTPRAELLTAEGKAEQADYNDRIRKAREELESAVLRLVAEHAETFRGDWGVPAAWLRSLADDPAELSLLAVRPDERETDTPAVPEAAPPTGQADLQERIAEVIHDDLTTHGARRDLGLLGIVPRLTGAVMAVLPALVDPAAVLREEAARIRAHCPDHLDDDSAEGAWLACHCAVADDLLRRLAAKPQPSEPESGCAHCGGPHAWDDCEAYTALVAEGPVRCPLCPYPVTLHTPNGARAHFTTVHPEQQLVGPGPWPMLGTPPTSSADEPHRLALSTALGLGTSAPWDAIRERAAELTGQGVAGGRAAGLREAADAITAVIERDRAYSPRRSNDRAALGGAREIVLGLINQPGRVADEEQPDDYEATTGHAVTCLAVAGGASDPDCPACHPKFGIDGCTCIPFTRQTDPPRYLNRPTDTVDMISGWEPGADCPHHAPPTPLAKIVRWVESEPVTANTEFGNGYRECQRDIRDLLKGRFDRDPQTIPPAVVAEPGKENEADRIVGYRSDGGRLIHCLQHVPPPAARHADFHPVTSEDLPDGGICTYPECGVDVLAQQPKEA